MKKIGFIGAYDKTDFIVYIAKILTVLGKKVLVVDSTVNQKARYVVPFINPTKMYVTSYEEIDVAIGFEDLSGIRHYIGLSDGEELEYDYIFVDTDSAKVLSNFRMEDADQNYFVTSFDIFSLKKGLEILANLENPMKMTKVLFTRDMLDEEDEYLNFLSLPYKVQWNKDKIYFPFEQGDQSAIIENQRVEKIKIKNLTEQYTEALIVMTEEILENVSSGTIRRTVKQLEKGV
jgi:hypothetical protein